MSLSVILCVRNGAATMRGQLDALVRQEWDERWEILVVDNGSTDDTAIIAAEYVGETIPVRVISAHERSGLSYARNVGVANANGESVAFCDDDDRVGDGWVAAMGNALRNHSLVASRMEYGSLTEDAARVGRADFQSQRLESMFGHPIVNGASGWRRDLWLALGGNDESLDFGGEDLDMSLRAVINQKAVPYFARDAVYHCGRRVGRQATYAQARRYGRSHVVLYKRYGKGRGEASTAPVLVMKQWLWLARSFRDRLDPEKSTLWGWRAGMRVGRLEGSLRERTLYL